MSNFPFLDRHRIPSADREIKLTPEQLEKLNAIGKDKNNMQEHIHDENCQHVVTVEGAEAGEQAIRHGANITIKPRANNPSLGQMTIEDLQRLGISLTENYLGREVKTPLTPQQIAEKRIAEHQKVVENRRARKSVKNAALMVAKTKQERRRVERGATAQDLLNLRSQEDVKPQKRARTLRREAARNMAKLARKFSTKQAEPTQTGGTTE